MRIHYYSLFLFPLVYLFQNLITVILKSHQVTNSINMIEVYWISLWIDYLAARMINKSIKHGMCDRSAKDAYSIMALDRTSKFFLQVCVYVSPLNTVRFTICLQRKFDWSFPITVPTVPTLNHHNSLFSRWSTKRDTSLNLTSNLGNNR